MKKILPLFIPVFFLWPAKVVEWVIPKIYNSTKISQAEVHMPASLATCGTCPELLGFTIEVCGTDTDNEYLILLSGSGFNVSDLVIDLDSSNNDVIGSGDEDPGTGTCDFSTPSATLISNLQALASCVQPAEEGDVIPCCAVVIVYMDQNAAQIDDLSYICGLGFDVYVLQNACNGFLGAFSNFNSGCTNCQKDYAISVPGCVPDTITYFQNVIGNSNDGTGHVLINESSAYLIGATACQPNFSHLLLPSPPSLPVISSTVSHVTCNGDGDGSITLSISGGTPPYCVDWEDVLGNTCPTTSESATLSNLAPGSYTVTVTDAGGCMDVATITISEPTEFKIDTFSSGLACNGGPTGSIALVVTGGTPFDTIINPDPPFDSAFVYSYDWDWLNNPGNEDFDADMNMEEDEDLSSLYAGMYSVVITDKNGCTAIATATVDSFASPMIITAPDTVALPCSGGTTNVNITVTGGFPSPPENYNYDWDEDGIFDDPEDLVGVGAGIYIVAVTEPISGCLSYDTVVVTTPPLLTLSVNETDADCNSMPVGSYVITVTGGTGPFDYNDGTNMGTNVPGPTITVNNAPAGSYTVTVTDNNGCTATSAVTINVPTAISISAFASGLACNGGPTGSIGLLVSGGIPSDTLVNPDPPFDSTFVYSYDWDWLTTGPNDVFDADMDMMDDEDLSNLFDGQYTVTVTDLNGCTATTTVTVDLYISPMIITAPDSIMLGCGGGNTNINITVTGGFPTPPENYNYDWDEDGIFDDPEDLTNVGAGTYIVAVTEPVSGCLSYDTIVVSGPDTLTAMATGNIAVCGGTPSGSITVVVTGGTGPFDYVLNSIPFNPMNTQTGTNLPTPITINNVSAGDYGIQITDANGCITFTSTQVFEIDTLSAEAVATPILCFDGTTNVTVAIDGGTGPFCYAWSTGAGSCPGSSGPASLTNVPAGTYTVTVMDANMCITVAQVTVTEPPEIMTSIMASICANESYMLPDGSMTSTGGTYVDTLTAANGCDSIVTVMLTVTPLLTKTVNASHCDGDSVQVYGIWYTGPIMGSLDTANSTTGGCDTIVTINVTVNPLLTKTVNASHCDGDSVQVYGIWYTGPIMGSLDTANSTTGGCDTIVTINVTVNPLLTKTVNASHCDGDSVQVYGIWYTGPIMGSLDTANSTTGGCDTVVTINVTVNPLLTKMVNASHCDGDSVQVYGVWYTGPVMGSLDTVNSTTGGCDTVVTINVTVNPLLTKTVNASHCDGDSVQVYGIWYTGPIMGSLDTANSTTGGCDTIVTINVTVTPLLTKTVDSSHCDGDSVQVYGIWYTGPIMGSLDTVNSTTGGCDTVVTINVTVNPLLTKTVDASHCDGDSVQVYGVWYTGPVMGSLDTVNSATGGCDTVVTINVTVNPLLTKTVNASHCDGDSVQVYGVWYTGPIMGSLDTANSTTGGCDTVVTINVTVTPLLTKTVDASHCDGDSVQVYGVWYTGPIMGSLDTANSTTGGCDTVVTINVTVTPLLTKTVDASHCDGDSVQVYGIWYTGPVAGKSDTAASTTGGCDTVVTINVTVTPLLTKTVNASHCDGDSVQVYGVWYTGPVMGSLDTANSTTGGCDTVVTINVTVTPLLTKTVNASHCDGDSVQVYGVWYTGPVMGSLDTANSTTGGCDTVVTINVTVTPLLTKTVDASHCDGDSVQVYGIWYTGPVAGALDTAASTTGGCDTVVTINVSITPLLTKTVNVSHCPGDSVQVYGVWYIGPVSGALDTAASTTGGCDTVVTINVSINPLLTKTVNASHCDGDSVQVYGIWYTGPVSGALDTAASTTGGCDTVVTINVSVTPLIPKPVSASFCVGDSVQVYGVWYYMAGAYMDTIASTTGGCDTLVTINVTEDPYETSSVTASFCAGDSVQVYGVWYDTPGTATDTISSVTAACDTIVTISITEDPLETNTINVSHCPGDSVQVYGVWYIGANVYTDTISSTTGGCDTIATINVSLLSPSSGTVTNVGCTGDGFSVIVNGTLYNEGNPTGTETLTNGAGCDSIVTISLTFGATSIGDETYTGCIGDGYSVTVGTTTYNESNPGGTEVLTNAAGCDSTITINLVFNNTSMGSETYSGCMGDGYSIVVGSTTYNEANPTGSETLTNANGCDSVVTISLTFNNTSVGSETYAGCIGDGYSVVVGSTTYDEANPTGTETLTNVNGCDSVVTISLTFNNTSVGSETYAGCVGDGYSVVIGSTTYDESNPTGSETLTNANGCDSVVTVSLTFNSTSVGSETYTGCQGDGYSVVVGSTTYDESNPTGSETLTNANGCDSVVTISLTFNNTSVGSETYTGCQGDGYSVVVGSTAYDEANPTGSETLTNANGCDSVVTVDLTFNNTSVGSETYTGCIGDGYSVVVGSTTYDQANPTGTETLTNVNGCDSVVTISLTFNNTSVGSETYAGCQGDGYSVVVGSTTYDESNPTGSETLTNANGCDSVVTISLTFNNTSVGSETYTGCQGDGYSVVVGSTTYDEANPTGSETLTNANGCDSVVTISLTFNNTSVGSEIYSGCIGDGYSVVVGSTTYNETNPTGTETLSNAAGCDSVVTINLTFNNTSTGNENYTGCIGDGYSVVVGSTTYDETNPTGTETLSNAAGCDSVVTINLTFNNTSTGNENYTGCTGDGYSVVVGSTTYDETNPTGTETLSNAAGCDSVVTIALMFGSISLGSETYTGCQGDGYSVTVGSTTYDESNPTGMETLTGAGGCDSIVTVTLTFNPETIGSETYTGCDGDGYSVVVGSTTYDETNPTGTEILTNAAGCDSIVTITLIFNNSSSGSETYTGCIGDGYSVIVGGITYDETNPTGTESLTNAVGCDSVVTVSLIFNNTSTGSETYSGCIGDGYSVVVGGTTYDEGNPAGTEILTGSNGCDSVVTVSLVFNANASGSESYAGCTGDGYSVIVGGTTYDETNPSGTEILTSGNGCDSIVTVSLTFNSPSIGTEAYVGCVGDGYSVIVGSTTYDETNSSGTEILTNANGCDSVVTVSLTFNAASSGDETYQGCIGDGYSVVVGSTTYDESNPAGTETLTNVNGCDSVVTINLTFDNTSSGSEVYTGCIGDGYSVIVGGTVYDESNPTGTEILLGANGCDSVVTINLVFSNSVSGDELYSGCIGDGYSVVVNGNTYDENNPTGSETLTSGSGCDSVVTINLIFNNASTGDETYAGCVGDGYSVVVNGTTYDENNPSGSETIPNANGCDSVVTIALTFQTSSTGDETYTGCQGDGYSVIVDGNTYDENNPNGIETLTNSVGCDSVVTIALTFHSISTGSESHNGCIGDGYSVIVNGNIYDEANPVGSEVLPNSNGCDSTVTINLVFANSVMGEELYNGCTGDGYSVNVNGTTYDENNPTGTETLISTAGCDSIVTINLMFNDFVTGDETYSGCEGDGYSVIVNGNIYDESNPTGTETLISGAGCDSIVTIDLIFATAPIAAIDPAGPFCADEGPQSLTALPGGGVWSGDVSSNQFNPTTLGPGQHQVIYTVSAGTCDDADTILVTVNPAVIISCTAVLGESAPGAMDGTGDVTVFDGTAPYDIAWSGPVSGSDVLNANGTYTITGLAAGNYDITVTDANGCSGICTFDIISSNCTVVIDGVDIIDAGCAGVDNGAIQINASGGTPPYMYSIDGTIYQSSNVFNGLAAGTIQVFVQDDAGCIRSVMVDIQAGAGPTINLVGSSPSSCGQSNGSIEVNATGGTPPYDFSNGGPFQPIGTFNGLDAGSYEVVVRDDGGCTDTIMVDIIDDGAPVIDGIVANSANCGQSNGSITVTASGGAQPLTYSLNGGPPQASNVFSGLPSGIYDVDVIDQNDCHVVSQIQIIDSGAPTIDDIIVTETACGSATGSIEVIASGGTGALSYRIDLGAFGANAIFQNLTSGNHTINVRDAAGCVVSVIVNVPSADGPQIISTPVIHTSCGEENGQITINTSGGTGTLTFCIDPGGCQDDDDVFGDLDGGTYEITVEDENGCSAQAIITINDSEGPTVDAIQEDEHCDNAEGYVILFGIGGVTPYMYSFDGRPYSTNDFYGGLSSDLYTVCVRDAQGCIDCMDVFIDNDDAPDFISADVTESSCDQSDGTITIFASSFFALEYSINCTFYQTSNVFTGLAPGTYTICIRDAFDCVTSVPVTIDPLPEPSIDNVIIVDAACTAPGSLTVISSGGNGVHQYSLNNMTFQASNVFTGLGAGNYTIEIEDERGCTDQTSVTIAGPVLDMTSLTEVICEGEFYTVGTLDFDSTGIYEVSLAGSDGCDSIVTLNLTVQPCCTPSMNTVDALICEGDAYQLNGIDYTIEGTYTDTIVAGAANGCDSILLLNLGVIPVVITNQQGMICAGEVYDWNGQLISLAGFYTDTLVSATTGCDSILTLDLIVNALPTISAGADMTLTCSVTSVTLDGSGTGTPVWTGSGINDPNVWQTVVNSSGTYYLTATSADGCLATDSVVVSLDPNFPVADAGTDLFITCEDSVLTLQGSANSSGLLFTWSGPGILSGQEHDEMPVITEAGMYILSVEDTVNQCVSPPDTVLVTDIRVDLLANINASGNLDCNNSSVLLTSGGSSSGPGIVYIWLNPLDVISLDVPSITATIPGKYYLFAIDSLSICQDVDSIVILDLTSLPPADAGIDTVLDCNVGFLGLEANATSPQAGLLFSWTGPAGGILGDPNSREITIIAPGTYTVTVLDTFNGCTNTDEIIVTDSRNLPTANAGPTQFIDCRDDTAILDGSLSSVGAEYMYTWNGPGIQNVHAISIEVELPGFYRLDVTNMENGCEASDTTEVQMANFLSGADISLIDPICLNDASGQIIIELPQGGVPPYQYSLDGIDFQSSPVFSNLDAGSHSLIIRDNVNCEWDTTVIINEGIVLTLDIGPDIEIDFGDMTGLFATIVPPDIIDSIIWEPLEVLSCNDCLDPVLTALYPNNFVISATAYAGTCRATDDLLVIVDSDINIFVPNVFSPNNDNINDYVTAFAGDEVVRILEFDIFDRWGELIFQGFDFPPNIPEEGWDGRFKGDLMNPGVFVYMLKVELIDGSELILSGDITLVR